MLRGLYITHLIFAFSAGFLTAEGGITPTSEGLISISQHLTTVDAEGPEFAMYSSLFSYDGLDRTIVPYDRSNESAITYDAVAALVTSEEKNSTGGDCALFARFARFLTAEGIATPYGQALQATTPEAQAALQEVQSGATVYRQGQFGVQNTTDAQFWSLNNPATTPGYAGKMGMPAGSTTTDWIMGGTVRPGAPVITRPAPAGPGGVNLGGNIEAVVNPGDVQGTWFYMP